MKKILFLAVALFVIATFLVSCETSKPAINTIPVSSASVSTETGTGTIDLSVESTDGDYNIYNATVKDAKGNVIGHFRFGYMRRLAYSEEAMFGNLGLDYKTEDELKTVVRILGDGDIFFDSRVPFCRQYIVKSDGTDSTDGYVYTGDKLYGFSAMSPEEFVKGVNNARLEFIVYSSKGELLAMEQVNLFIYFG